MDECRRSNHHLVWAKNNKNLEIWDFLRKWKWLWLLDPFEKQNITRIATAVHCQVVYLSWSLYLSLSLSLYKISFQEVTANQTVM